MQQESHPVSARKGPSQVIIIRALQHGRKWGDENPIKKPAKVGKGAENKQKILD